MPPLVGVRIRKNDRLFLRAISSVAGILTIRIRVLYDNGQDDDLLMDPVTGTADRTTQTAEGKNRATANGWVIGGELSVGGVATKRGQFYCDLSTTDGSAFTPMMKGYVYDGHSLTPGEFVEPGPGGGEGFIRVISTADPAAGAEVARTAVDTNALWRPLAFSVTMAQGATQTPHPALLFTNSAPVTLDRVPIGADVAASTTVRCTWHRGSDTRNNVTSGEMVAAMPDLLLDEGFGIETLTEGIGAASDYGVAILTVEEWLVL